MTDSHLSGRPDQSGHYAACELANMGFRVFPYYPLVGTTCSCPGECDSPGKHPRISRYLDLATTDLEQLGKWWHRWPNAGIGICPDNQLILDVDGPSGHASLEAMLGEHGNKLPPTFTCVSGSDEPHHYHLYFRLPDGTRVLNKPLCRYTGLEAFPNIDVRSHRGQIAAPGTLHRDGDYYRWECSGLYQSLGKPNRVTDLPMAPAWLLSALGGVMISESQPTHRIRKRSNGVLSHGDGDMNLPPESNGWYLKVIRERWPITRKGQRNCLQGKPVTYLVAKGISINRIREIMADWLSGYSEVFETSMTRAFKELDDCIDRNQRNLDDGKIKRNTDHSNQSSVQELHPILKRFLNSTAKLRVFVGQEAGEHSNDLSVPPEMDESRNSSERRTLLFVWALMLHYQYRVAEFGETDTIRMTHFQLQEILEKRFSTTIHRRHLYKLADQFVTRDDQHGKEKRASVLELLKQTKRGYTGTPSEYAVTGLPPLA